MKGPGPFLKPFTSQQSKKWGPPLVVISWSFRRAWILAETAVSSGKRGIYTGDRLDTVARLARCWSPPVAAFLSALIVLFLALGFAAFMSDPLLNRCNHD